MVIKLVVVWVGGGRSGSRRAELMMMVHDVNVYLAPVCSPAPISALGTLDSWFGLSYDQMYLVVERAKIVLFDST